MRIVLFQPSSARLFLTTRADPQVIATGALPLEDLRKCHSQEEIFIPIQATKDHPLDPNPYTFQQALTIQTTLSLTHNTHRARKAVTPRVTSKS